MQLKSLSQTHWDRIKKSIKIAEMDKKGQVINTMNSTFIGILIFVFLIFAILFGVSILNPASFFTAGSANALAIGNMTENLTAGASESTGQLKNVGKMFAVVMILSVLALLILYVRRMQDVGGDSGGL